MTDHKNLIALKSFFRRWKTREIFPMLTQNGGKFMNEDCAWNLLEFLLLLEIFALLKWKKNPSSLSGIQFNIVEIRGTEKQNKKKSLRNMKMNIKIQSRKKEAEQEENKTKNREKNKTNKIKKSKKSSSANENLVSSRNLFFDFFFFFLCLFLLPSNSRCSSLGFIAFFLPVPHVSLHLTHRF